MSMSTDAGGRYRRPQGTSDFLFRESSITKSLADEYNEFSRGKILHRSTIAVQITCNLTLPRTKLSSREQASTTVSTSDSRVNFEYSPNRALEVAHALSTRTTHTLGNALYSAVRAHTHVHSNAQHYYITTSWC